MKNAALLRIAVFDYGAGNLHSLVKALALPETIVRVEPDPALAADRSLTDLLVLPGVGAFAAAAARIGDARASMQRALDDGLCCLGICLGMQLLFDASEEGEGDGAGLGVVQGRVRRLRAARVPQIGWNTVHADAQREPAFAASQLSVAYYANSYVGEPASDLVVSAWSEHDGDRFPAAVRAGPRGNVVGVQFHPEKSSAAGVAFVRGIARRAREEVQG